MLDSPKGVCPGQVRFEYPATSVPFSKLSWAELQGAFLLRTSLRVADLEDANLQEARSSHLTVWPAGFDWKAAGVAIHQPFSAPDEQVNPDT